MADPETTTGKARARLFSWRRPSLTVRILVLNVIALGLMAGSMFYLDSYRNQLLNERFRLARGEAKSLPMAWPKPRSPDALPCFSGSAPNRNYACDCTIQGSARCGSFALSPPSFVFIDPASEPWYQQAARILDRGMNWILGTAPIPSYRDPRVRAAWPELGTALAAGSAVVAQRAAPDETPVINAATPVGVRGRCCFYETPPTSPNRYATRARTLAIVLAVTLLISIQLSLFLAGDRSAAAALVRAAIRERSGREREVVVPRLPERGDEIGLLARAISDMTTALRQKIDSVETLRRRCRARDQDFAHPCAARLNRWARSRIRNCAANCVRSPRTMSSASTGWLPKSPKPAASTPS
ncbi:MAG: sensor N-terminal transmembrane domain-containing protein [Novosphingobium sp.]